MRHGAWWVWAVAVLILSAGRPVHAHTLSESFSSWQLNGDEVHVEFSVPDREVKRLSASGRDMPSSAQFVQYMAEHIGVRTHTASCTPMHAPQALASIAGFERAQLDFKCPRGGNIVLHSSAFYDLVSTHTNFARIQATDGTVFEQLLTQDHEDVDTSYGGAEGSLQNAGLLKFILMGVMHIFTGVDHMSFMLGLVLISKRLRDLLFVITGFTIGHSLTLGLAVTGVLRPNGQYIDALVALTIALIGAENVGDSTHRPAPVALSLGGILAVLAVAKLLGVTAITLPTLILAGGSLFATSYLMMTGQMRDAGRVRVLVTVVFGLIHGFGFASNLLELQLPAQRTAELLFGFNVGVEIGQVSVVLTALLIAHLLKRVKLAIPRPLFGDLAASFLVGEGLVWFITRSVALA
jgi:HupE / UreJ protein